MSPPIDSGNLATLVRYLTDHFEDIHRRNMTLMDAFISCWDEKYRSNRIRPETVINRSISIRWQPLLQTPPFPEYTSGHSVISTAVAELLSSTLMTGTATQDRVAIDDRLAAVGAELGVSVDPERLVVSGSGLVLVTATEQLDASVPGSGAILYSGDPAEVAKSITGSGAITPA